MTIQKNDENIFNDEMRREKAKGCALPKRKTLLSKRSFIIIFLECFQSRFLAFKIREKIIWIFIFMFNN